MPSRAWITSKLAATSKVIAAQIIKALLVERLIVSTVYIEP